MSKCYCKLQEEKIPPKPYVYEYGGVDASGLAAAKTESQDADGVLHGKTNVLYLINNPRMSWRTDTAIHGQTIGPIEKFISLKFLKFL